MYSSLLVLMDLQMPNCDGAEATRQIRKLEEVNGWPRAIIVIVTGQDSPQDRLLSKEAGADDFFVKPVGPKVLDRGFKEWWRGACNGKIGVSTAVATGVSCLA